MKTYEDKTIKEIILDRVKLSRINCDELCFIDLGYKDALIKKMSKLKIPSDIVGNTYIRGETIIDSSGGFKYRTICYNCIGYDNLTGLTKFKISKVYYTDPTKYTIRTDISKRYVIKIMPTYKRDSDNVRNDIAILDGGTELRLINIGKKEVFSLDDEIKNLRRLEYNSYIYIKEGHFYSLKSSILSQSQRVILIGMYKDKKITNIYRIRIKNAHKIVVKKLSNLIIKDYDPTIKKNPSVVTSLFNYSEIEEDLFNLIAKKR